MDMLKTAKSTTYKAFRVRVSDYYSAIKRKV